MLSFLGARTLLSIFAGRKYKPVALKVQPAEQESGPSTSVFQSAQRSETTDGTGRVASQEVASWKMQEVARPEAHGQEAYGHTGHASVHIEWNRAVIVQELKAGDLPSCPGHPQVGQRHHLHCPSDAPESERDVTPRAAASRARSPSCTPSWFFRSSTGTPASGPLSPLSILPPRKENLLAPSWENVLMILDPL